MNYTMNTDTIGNLTTIIKFIIMTIAPYLSLTEAMQNQLIGIIVSIIGFILAYYDAKYQNTVIISSDANDNSTEETTYSSGDDGTI